VVVAHDADADAERIAGTATVAVHESSLHETTLRRSSKRQMEHPLHDEATTLLTLLRTGMDASWMEKEELFLQEKAASCWEVLVVPLIFICREELFGYSVRIQYGLRQQL